jgi:hypothetical protein
MTGEAKELHLRAAKAGRCKLLSGKSGRSPNQLTLHCLSVLTESEYMDLKFTSD